MENVTGIHHITAMAGDPQKNLDFYAGVLGLRLVKLTVNFDDPGTYHFYYGDGLGRPGTLLTFFPWPQAAPGRAGVHQVGAVSLAVPQGSLGYWLHRLMEKGVAYSGPFEREGAQVVAFKDPDGLQLELVATPHAPEAAAWEAMLVPAEHAVRGVHAAQMWVLRAGPSVRTLEAMGYRVKAQRENVTVMVPEGGFGAVEVREAGGFLAARGGVGTVHHVAFRVPDDDAELALREKLLGLGLRVSEVRERQYFRSVYFREPGGVLFEVATDTPGFTADEPFEALGSSLKLPPWLEASRAQIELALPKIAHPGAEVRA